MLKSVANVNKLFRHLHFSWLNVCTPKGSVNLCSVAVKKLQTKFFFTGNKFTGFNAMETVLQVITVLVLKFKTLAMYSASQCMCIAVN